MDRHHRAPRLPVELLSMAFDSLSLQDLLAASRVSSFWHNVAFRHRTFWADITLASLSPAALDLFHARLRASSHQSIVIQVLLPDMLFPAHVRPFVLSRIASNMHRIEGLYFKVDIDADVDICEMLRLPAPRLTTLHLWFLHEMRMSEALPIDLFADYAPRLRTVQLLNVQLASNYLPPALSAVTVLRYFSYDAQSLPAAVFTHCKALQELSIWGKHCSLSADDDQAYVFAIEKLCFLNMAVVSGSFNLVQLMPCASIQNMLVPLVDLQSACVLLDNLRGELEVRLECTDKEVRLQYTSLATNMSRIFQGPPAPVAGGKLSRAYVTDDLLARVASVHATAGSTDLLSAFAYLPSCTSVNITLADDDQLVAPAVPLYVPELLRVSISFAREQVVHVGILYAFLDTAFLAVSHVVQLALDGVKLDGDVSTITRDRFAISVKQKKLLN